MKLKLLAPFISPHFALRSATVLEDAKEYQQAWLATRAAFDPARDLGGTSDRSKLHFAHAIEPESERHSRYRTIDSHSLIRPLPVLQLRLGLNADDEKACLDNLIEAHSNALEESQRPSGAEEKRIHSLFAAIARDLREREALIRVYDHRVSTFQVDLNPGSALATLDPAEAVDTVESLRLGAIAWAEQAIEDYYDSLLAPLFTWLTHSAPIGSKFLEDDASARVTTDSLESLVDHSGRTLWVTRTLILEEEDGLSKGRGAEIERTILGRAVIEHWLRDVPGPAAGSGTNPVEDVEFSSAQWLNYLFAEHSYEGTYPSNGWKSRGEEARAFCPAWDAMEIAQYYYAAFDLAQTSISRTLAISLSRSGTKRLSEIHELLDAAIRDVQMLHVEYAENTKYYSRQVANLLNQILQSWSFEEIVLKETERRLESCVQRLKDLHARSEEQSSLMMGLVLLLISVTSVFGVVLTLAQHGRLLTYDPDLIPYEQGTFNTAQWIAGRSTDDVLIASVVLAAGFFGLYYGVRALRSPW